MRFEELAYTVDGLPVTVGFHTRLTVLSLPAGDGRAEWIARLLGVLEGVREGDGASLVYVDQAGRRIRLERDEHGAATLADLAKGQELRYSAAHLSLDGRLDWFASVNAAARRAVEAMLLGPEALAADRDYERSRAEAQLEKARRLVARVEGRRQAAIARSRQCGELLRRITELDEQIDPAAGTSPEPPSEPPGAVPGELEALAVAWRTAAERRDALVARLDRDDAALKELVDDVEPAFVDALLAFADACRAFDVVLDAARIEAAGVGATGVAALTGAVLAEVAARVPPLEPVAAGEEGSGIEVERSRLIDELHRLERRLPDEAELARRHSALERRVAALAASLEADRWLPSVAEAEGLLRRRAEKARRVGRCKEPLPLVVDDALSGFSSSDKVSLLDALCGLSEITQIVYLAGDPETVAWASARAATGGIGLWQPEGIASVA